MNHQIGLMSMLLEYLKFAMAKYSRKEFRSQYFMLGLHFKNWIIETENLGIRASEFGPRKLKAFQSWLVAKRQARSTINKTIGRVKYVFKWAVSDELISAGVLQALQSVAGIGIANKDVKQSEPIEPVDVEQVRLALAHMSPVIAAVIQVQYLCGMRPSETLKMRPCDIDRSGDVWLYSPSEHKNTHKGKTLTKAIPESAQRILEPFLDRPDEEFLFKPSEGTTRGFKHPKYGYKSYGRAVKTACEKAGIVPWFPLQLRHAIATELATTRGTEVAQKYLGHARLNTTEIYAEKTTAELIEIAEGIENPF
jgi:integrase